MFDSILLFRKNQADINDLEIVLVLVDNDSKAISEAQKGIKRCQMREAEYYYEHNALAGEMEEERF